MRLIIALTLLSGFLQQIEAASSNDDISDDEGKETQTILPRLKYLFMQMPKPNEDILI